MTSKLVSPDNQAVIKFLALWAPEGPWALTSIQTDRKGINTATFYPKDVESTLMAWLVKYNGVRNIYFHVNPPMKDISKKADREDIKSVDWFHVDIDPRAGEDIDEERVRALGLLTDKLPKGVPAPTCIVFSGGGYQGFWRLTSVIKVNGDVPAADDAARYNIQLELLFGADNCHNVDRIMRLPGTVNIPDARKIKKGRVATLAKLVEFNDNAYDLSEFTAAPVKQTEGDGTFSSGEGVKISGNIERIDDESELDKWDIPDRVKIIMAQGKHPDQPKEGDNSRSAWLFDFCCQLVRAEVPDEVIFSIITDPGWPISASVLEMKGSAEKYAIKQIESAKLFAIDPKLVYFNGKYAVIKNYGGKCLVVTDLYDHALERDRLTRLSLENFEKGYENQVVEIGVDANGNPKYKPAGTWWRKHPKRRQYESIAFAPERQLPDNIYNLWRGFSVNALPGDCDLYLDHMFKNVCNSNQEHYDYLIGWMARCVQYPGRPGEVAVVLRGGRGVGKSFFAKVFGDMFGRHFMQVSNSSHLVGNFNSHLRDLIVLFADEAFFAGDKKHESILKTLVTEEMMVIEAKGVDVEMAPNCIHLIMSSNDLHVIPAGGDERRFFVVDVGKGNQKDTTYFAAIAEQMENGGTAALLHHLLTYDLSEYNVRNVPATDALHEQKLLSLNVVEEWWYQKLLSGTTLRNDDKWHTEVQVTELTDDFVEEVRRFNANKRGSGTAMGRFLKKVCPDIKTMQKRARIEIPAGEGWTKKVERRVRFYSIPTLAECRAIWEEQYGPEKWDVVESQPELGEGGDIPF